jgi:CRP-like cAMP-binding protein
VLERQRFAELLKQTPLLYASLMRECEERVKASRSAMQAGGGR